jgi:hypothetical protein
LVLAGNQSAGVAIDPTNSELEVYHALESPRNEVPMEARANLKMG